MNWAQQIATSKANIMDYRTILPDGRPAFYFVDIDPSKVAAFKEAIKSGQTFRIDSFGRVIVSGFGEPQRELMDAIREEYGH